MNYKFKQFLRTNSIIQAFWCYSEIIRIVHYLFNNRRKTYISKFADRNKISDKNYVRRFKKELLYCLLRYGAWYDEYFLYQFENKDKAYRRSFITENRRYNYCNKLNKHKNKILFDDKWKTYQVFQKYYKRDIICIRNKDDLEDFYEFLKKHPVFILKPLALSMGEGISIIDVKEHDNIQFLFEALLKKAPCLIEEIIIQTDHMSKLHPASVNTIRMTTILTGHKNSAENVHIVLPVIKMGQNESIVDNAGAGGILAIIDSMTGVISTIGVDEGNKKYITHPNTGMTIEGFKIPRWKEAVDLAKELALIIPTNRFSGWDLALTDNGWVMVEGNSNAQLNYHQLFDLKGRREELDELSNQIKL